MRRFHFPRHIDPAVWPGAVIAVAYTVCGLGMLLQSERFMSTPAYGNLTELLDIQVWGALYLIVAVLFSIYTLAVTSRVYGMVVHTLAIMLTFAWLMAFVIRWATDAGTTVVNVASWSVFLLLVARSAQLIPSALARDAR